MTNLAFHHRRIFKTGMQLDRINAGLASGDESNVLEFLKLILKSDGALGIPEDDDIVTACMVTHQGESLKN